jgi:hypothetical protein
VAQQFALTFDGCRAKVGDIQLEINEEFISSARSLLVVSCNLLRTGIQLCLVSIWKELLCFV